MLNEKSSWIEPEISRGLATEGGTEREKEQRTYSRQGRKRKEEKKKKKDHRGGG